MPEVKCWTKHCTRPAQVQLISPKNFTGFPLCAECALDPPERLFIFEAHAKAFEVTQEFLPDDEPERFL